MPRVRESRIHPLIITSAPPPLEKRGERTVPTASLSHTALGEEDLLRLSSTIHEFMPVELFLLEENQITHTFWKLLMTAFQSASGWLSVMICIFIYSSYIKKFTPVRSWQSVSIFNLFRENSLLADIIQISFYQKSGWHNRWRYKKYAADKQRILMRDRDFCTSIKGMEITILIPDTLNCTWSPWVIVRRRHKWQLQNFLYYPGWHQNFLFYLRNRAWGQTKQLSEQESL